MIINNVCLCRLYKFIEKKIAFVCIFILCSVPYIAWGQAHNADSLLREAVQLETYADSCMNVGDTGSALEAFSKSAGIRKETQGTDNAEYVNDIYEMSCCYAVLKNYDKAIEYGLEVKDIFKNIAGEEFREFAALLIVISGYNSNLNNYSEAIRLTTKALEIQKKVLGLEHPDYTRSLSLLAGYNHSLGNYSEAVRLESEVVEIQKKVYGPEHPDYARSLSLLAGYYSCLKNYSEAIKLTTKAAEIQKRINGPDHPDYAWSLSLLAGYYTSLGDYKEAVKLRIEALNIQKKILGAEHPDYARSLSLLASDYSHLNNYKEAIRLETEAMEIRKEVLGPEHPDYTSSLSLLADYNSNLGNYDEAVCLGKEALNIRKNILGIEHPDYIASLDALAIDYSNLGDYAEAIRLGTEVADLCKRILGREHPAYAASLNNLAIQNYNLGNYAEAIRLGTIALDIHKKIFGERNSNYANSLETLANSYSDLGNYAEAIRLGTEAMDIIKLYQGTDNPDYAISLNNLAYYYSDLGNYAKAIRLATEAMEILKNLQKEKHHCYAASLNNLAYFYSHLGNYAEAVRLETMALENREKVLGINHPEYAKSLSNLSSYNRHLHNYSEALKYAILSIKIKSDNIISSFSALSSQRKNSYWDRVKRNYAMELYELCLKVSDPILTSSLYDKSALLTKGILLNIEIEMKKLIEESNDPELIEEYQKILLNNDILNKQSSIPIAERYLNTDSLRLIQQKLEDDIISKSKAYGDYMRNLRLTWKDIQQSLKENDYAVEFLDFPVGQDSIMYVALTMRKESEHPKMTVLFEEKQLKQIPDTLYYHCKDMANLVWGPMLSEFEGIKSVYFSPAGALHKIGIEYLPGMEGYNLFRLSSTRELVSRKEKLSEESAVLYGGLDYYAKIDSVGNSNNVSKLDLKFVDHANVRSMKLRGGKEFLPYTKEEVEKIATELCEANWTCQLDTLEKGTEESFKSLSGKRVNTLHISTHGFYYTPEEADKKGYNFLRKDDRLTSSEDKSLTRSGLIMSGANHILEGEELPDDVEDGILTAKEIANVDLRGLDLVVLSACQTGLGDISQGEGVFGLQRGFKKAGANSILMSLWEVDDKATQILMTQFYKNLLAGQSKRQSLLAAQKYLREADGGKYKEPKYWAAFILLDGLN